MTEQGKNIFKDSLILIGLSLILAAVSLVVTKFFKVEDNPAADLVSAIKKDDSIAFEEALKAGLQKDGNFINLVDFKKRTPLMWAAYANNNNIETTERLQESLDNEEEEDAAAAKSASKKEKSKKMYRVHYVKRILAQKGVNVDQQDEDGWTALHWASWSGLDRVVERLIDSHAKVDNKEGNGYTPLMLAAMRGNDRAVVMLLYRGADRNLKNRDGKTALQLAIAGMAAYKADFDSTKTHVSKVNVNEVYKALDKARSKVERNSSDGMVSLDIVSKALNGAVAAAGKDAKDVDVRMLAYEATIKLLQMSPEQLEAYFSEQARRETALKAKLITEAIRKKVLPKWFVMEPVAK